MHNLCDLNIEDHTRLGKHYLGPKVTKKRDFRTELKDVKCWDHDTERLMNVHGLPLEDAILQNREELIGFCEWIEENNIRSYLEIGIWTGALITELHRLFKFERAYACDIGLAEQVGLTIRLSPDITWFKGNSRSIGYRTWRQTLGNIDLVMIDGDHRYGAVKRDFEINHQFRQQFIALHDITGNRPGTMGVRQLWEELGGSTHEIVRPHHEVGLGYSTMGIGIWRHDS